MRNTKYTDEHEWVAMEGDIATIGLTDFAQQQLGDIVFVDLPEIGSELEKGEEAAVVESVKAAGEIKSPIAGTVIEVNKQLVEAPDRINLDPMGDGWFIKLKCSDSAALVELMDEDAYTELVNQS